MKDTLEIVKYLAESGSLNKNIGKTIKKWSKRFLGMLMATLGASLLGNMLTGKGVNQAVEGTIKADQNF